MNDTVLALFRKTDKIFTNHFILFTIHSIILNSFRWLIPDSDDVTGLRWLTGSEKMKEKQNWSTSIVYSLSTQDLFTELGLFGISNFTKTNDLNRIITKLIKALSMRKIIGLSSILQMLSLLSQ